MWVVEGDGGGGVVWVLEFPDALLETLNVFAQELGSRLALAVVVLAGFGFLCVDALLAGRLGAVASLERGEHITQGRGVHRPFSVFWTRVVSTGLGEQDRTGHTCSGDRPCRAGGSAGE